MVLISASQIHNPKKRTQSSWLETDLDSGMTKDHGLDSPSSPAPTASLPRHRQNGNSHQQHSRPHNTVKDLQGAAYKENSHSHSPTQQQQQQHVRQTQSNQQQAFVQSHTIMDSTQDHISALSPQLREQIQQHQLKQQLLKDQMQGKASPVQTNATPLYVNTDSRRHGEFLRVLWFSNYSFIYLFIGLHMDGIYRKITTHQSNMLLKNGKNCIVQ